MEDDIDSRRRLARKNVIQESGLFNSKEIEKGVDDMGIYSKTAAFIVGRAKMIKQGEQEKETLGYKCYFLDVEIEVLYCSLNGHE